MTAVRLASADEEPPEPPIRACLVVIEGVQLGRKFDLDRGTTAIGRDQSNDICLPHEGISRVHATLVWDPHGVVIRDDGSDNGTFVNDHRIVEVALKNGDRVELARTTLLFLIGDSVDTGYHEELHRLSTIDALTHLLNRRYLAEVFERELSRAQRCDGPLSVVMLDIDRFARCNETFGVRVADEVLRQVAHRIRASVREPNVVARWEGDRFAILLPSHRLESALAFAESMRTLVSKVEISFDGHRVQVTVSAGVASLESSDSNAAGLINRAIARLAQAKAGGGDRTVS